MTAPDPALVTRFRADLAALLPDPGGRVLLAVSGGADSLAMLLLARAAMPGRIACATVDHGLRKDAAAEAAMVGGVCATLAIPHATLTAAPAWRPGGGNIQAEARRARYHLLARHCEEHGLRAILTAHHADDQAETFLMRANRGAGMAGLSGVRAVSRVTCCDHDVAIVRPLLGWRRASLAAIVTAAGLQPVDDPGNSDMRFDRTRVRALLQSADWIDVRRIAAAASHVAEANDQLDAIAADVAAQRLHPTEDAARWRVDVANLPRELTRRLARRAITAVREEAGIAAPDWDEGHGIEPLLDALEAGRGATRAGVQAAARGTIWTFGPAPPRRAG